MSTPSSTRERQDGSPSTRERILDAAAAIMRRDGLVRATTKQIAKEADCSEALLYKHFPDKHDIFLRVLTERSPRLDAATDWPGTRTVTANLEYLVVDLLEFYEQGFPIAASIFGDTELLTAHREAMAARGAGPHGPSTILMHYLDDEVQLGRLPALDTGAIAHFLAGAALHAAFLSAYAGEPISDSAALAHRLIAALNLDRS